MSFKMLASVNALVIVFFGLSSLLAPGLFWGSIYGLPLDEAGIWALRGIGALATGNAVLSWMMREVRDQMARRAFTSGFLIGWGLYLVLALQGQLAGLFNALNWSNVALAALWTTAFAYFRFIRRSVPAAA